MNHNPSFDMEAKCNCPPNSGHGVNRQFTKLGTHAFPQEPFAAGLFPGGLEELASQLLRLVNGKGQHHQHGKDNRQVLFAMTKVVFEMVALVLERIESLVLDFPACPTAAHQRVGIVFVNREISDPTEMANFIAFDFPVFQKIDAHMGV